MVKNRADADRHLLFAGITNLLLPGVFFIEDSSRALRLIVTSEYGASPGVFAFSQFTRRSL